MLFRSCVNEVALQEWADVGGDDAVEEFGELGADGSGIGSESGDRCGYDERRKERDHRGVGAGLGKVKPVMIVCSEDGAMDEDMETQEGAKGA